MARHAEKIAEVEAANDPKKDKKIELLMVGDSITNNFDKGGPGELVWEKHFAPLTRLEFGIWRRPDKSRFVETRTPSRSQDPAQSRLFDDRD